MWTLNKEDVEERELDPSGSALRLETGSSEHRGGPSSSLLDVEFLNN
jgi:hypothetical protein